MVYTNLDTNNMVKELELHFKNINNKSYIINCLKVHFQYGFIDRKDYDFLYNRYVNTNI